MDNIKPVKELELYIIRHGQSMGNAGYGREDLTVKEAEDPVLTELGISQACLAGDALSETDFDAVYSSALLRAVRTATEIIRRQPSEKPLNILPLLTEVGVRSEYEGAGMKEISSINPLARLADGVSETDSLVCCNKSDDNSGLFKRAETVIEYMRKRYKNGEKVALVAHAAFMTFLVFSIMGYSGENIPFYDIDFHNTSVTKVVFYKEGTNKYGDVVFEYINSTRHLTDKY